MRTKEIAKIASDTTRKFPSGSNATFVPLNDDWGVKFFDDADYRDKMWTRQRDAAWFDLAPKVGGCIEIKQSNHTMYGYITERVGTFAFGNECIGWDPQKREEGAEWEEVMQPEIDELSEQLIELTGYDCSSDSHIGNYGMSKDGRLLCIDFDSDRGNWEDESDSYISSDSYYESDEYCY